MAHEPVPPLSARPVSEDERIASLDVLRGFALLGILAMNIRAFAAPFSTYMNPTLLHPYEGASRAAYWFTTLVFDTKMMSLFSALFGAGLVVFAAKRTPRGGPATALWFRRSLWLLVIGAVHGYLIWEGDILVPYAECALLFLWWVRRLPAVVLAALAVAMLGVGGWMWWGFGAGFADLPPEEQAKQIGMWAPDDAQLREQIQAYMGSYPQVVRHRAPFVLMGHTMWFVMFFLWRAGGMMLLGAALMKWRVLTAERSARFYAGMAILGYALGLPFVWAGLAELERINFAFPQRTAADLYNYFASVPVALGHAGVVLLLVRLGAARAIVRRLAAAGRMAFSNYIAQSLICTTLFYGYGFGLFGRLDYAEQLLVVAAVWAALSAWSPWWLARFHFGPAEWAWRSLTYWRLQPFRRRSPERSQPAGPNDPPASTPP